MKRRNASELPSACSANEEETLELLPDQRPMAESLFDDTGKRFNPLDADVPMMSRRLPRIFSKESLSSQPGSMAVAQQRRGHSNRYKRIAAIRQDAVHKHSHRLATIFSVMGIEDLNLKGMGRKGPLARSVGDAGMRMFRTQMESRSSKRGVFLYPSMVGSKYKSLF